MNINDTIRYNIWFHLIQKRFQLNNTNVNTHSRSISYSARPKTYGADNWKHAYCNLSSYKKCRIPKCRYTSKNKIIFAKSSSHGASKGTTKNKVINDNKNNTDAALWIMLNHTENCNTRLFDNNTYPTNNQNQQSQRYIQLQICVQNIKSNIGKSLQFNFCESFLTLSKHHNQNNKVDVIKTGQYQPYIVYQSKDNNDKLSAASSLSSSLLNDIVDTKMNGHGFSDDCGIVSSTLGPLEFVIVVVSIPCPSDIIYETDFLCRVQSFHVPFIVKEQVPYQICNNHNLPVVVMDIYNNTDYIEKKTSLSYDPYPLYWSSQSIGRTISAHFIKESEIWDHYNILPGGCLARVHRSFGL